MEAELLALLTKASQRGSGGGGETTRNLLRGLQPVLEEEQINVQVTSALVENALKEERPLMATLRDRFGKQALTLSVTVKRNEGQSAVKIPKIAGNKEKLMNMYERNPAVKILAERFNLRFDGD